MEMLLEKPEAMIFDMDGTLLRTETLVLTAYRRTFDQLRKEGLYTGETPPEQRILGCLGMLLDEVWRVVIPDSDEAVRQRANELLLQYQIEDLKQGGGELYPGVPDTLRKLHERGIRLFVASNGLEDYIKSIIRYKGLAPYFEGLYSAGEYRTSTKAELVGLLLSRHGLRRAWMVGDRSSDVEAGIRNGLPVIGCGYAGFAAGGELKGATRIIRSFPELLELTD